MLPVRAFKNVLGIAMVLSITENEDFVKGIMVCDFSDSVRPVCGLHWQVPSLGISVGSICISH